VKEHDGRAAFEKFMEGVNRLLADENFREVLLELEAEGEEAVSLLAPDPAAFLRYRGVQIPEDFYLTVEQSSEKATGGGGGQTKVCYCLRICWWRWCVEFCVCKIVTRA
jgi:hypothetical protein